MKFFLIIVSTVVVITGSDVSNSSEILSKYSSGNFAKTNEDSLKTSKYLNKLNNYFNKRVKINEKSVSNYNENIKTIENQFKTFNGLLSNIDFNLKPIETRLKQTVFDFIISLNISNQCFLSLLQMKGALNKNELWPLIFFDASAKIPAGISSGVMSSFGDYEQCLAINRANIDNSSDRIYGKYCLLRPYLPYPDFKQLESIEKFEFLSQEMNDLFRNQSKEKLNLIKLLLTYNMIDKKMYLFTLGVCIPSQCTSNDLENVLNKVFYPVARIPVEVSPKCDVITDSIQLNKYQIIMLVILILFITWSLFCTTILITMKFMNKRKGINKLSSMKIIESFSVNEANKTLFSPLNDRLSIADALMLGYMFWQIMSTHYGVMVSNGFIGYKGIQTSFILNLIAESKYFWLRCMFPKDTIIFLGGVIIAFDFFGNKNRPLNVWQYIKFVGEKYYRFIPKMVAPILGLNILSIIGSGPIWHLGEELFVNTCSRNFWKNLLFINNFEGMPAVHCYQLTFILTVIFQLQIISPLFMLPFKYSPRFGYLFNLVLLPFACFATIAPKVIYGLKLIPYEVSELYSVPEMKHSFDRTYSFTDQYFSVFIIGIITGHMLRNSNSFDKIFKNRLNRTVSAALCYSLSVLGIVWSENFKDMNEKPNKLNLSLWFVFGKILWLFGNIWLIYVVYSWKKGVVNRILSSKVFTALTRLSFGIFLMSVSIIQFRVNTRSDNIAISHLNQIQLLYLDMSVTLIFAYLLYIFIEYPFINLLNVYRISKRVKIRGNNTHNNENNNNKRHDIELKYVFNE